MFLRRMDEATRSRAHNEAIDGIDELENAEEVLQDIVIPRSLEALDLAGL